MPRAIIKIFCFAAISFIFYSCAVVRKDSGNKRSASVFAEMAREYFRYRIKYPRLREVTLAQWSLESGWGSSQLCVVHKNCAGLKWHNFGVRGARKVRYKASDGWDYYASFSDWRGFFDYYWKFINRPRYNGWQKSFAKSPMGYIEFIKDRGYAQDRNYVPKVRAQLPKIRQFLRENRIP